MKVSVLLRLIAACGLLLAASAHAAEVKIQGQHLRADGSVYDFEIFDGDALSPGDRFQIVISTNSPTYYSVIYVSRDGQASQLFPLSGARGYMKANTQKLLPTAQNYFTLDDNGGRELMFVVTSANPIGNLKSALKGVSTVGKSAQEIHRYLNTRLDKVEKLEIKNTGKKVLGLTDQVSSGLVRDIARSYQANPWPESFSDAPDTRRRTRQADDTIPEAVRQRAAEVRELLRRPSGTPDSSSLRTVAASPPPAAAATKPVAQTDNNTGLIKRGSRSLTQADLEAQQVQKAEQLRKAREAEAQRLAAERKRVEAERLAAEAAAREQEQRRIAAEKAAAEEQRLLAQQQLAEEQTAHEAELARKEHERQAAEKARLEQERLAAERAAEAQRLAEEEARLQAELAEAERAAEAKRLASERDAARLAEEQRIAAEAAARKAEQKRLAAEAAAREAEAARQRQIAQSGQTTSDPLPAPVEDAQPPAEDEKQESGGFFGKLASILGSGSDAGEVTSDGPEIDSTGTVIGEQAGEPDAPLEPEQQAAAPVEAVVVLQAPVKPAPPVRTAPAPVRVEPAAPASTEELRQLYDQVAASIVSVSTSKAPNEAGFILDTKGHVLTSWHAVNGVESIDVKFIGVLGAVRSYQANVVRMDKFRDLALLQLVNPPEGVEPIVLSSSGLPDAGTKVRVFGQKNGQLWATDDAVITRIAENFTWFSTDNVIHRGEILQIDLPSTGKGIGSLVTSMDYKLLGMRSFSGSETGRTYAVSVRTILDFVQGR